MQLNSVASTVLVVFYLLTSVVVVAILAFFLYSLTKLNAKLESLEKSIAPLLTKAEEILTLTNNKITTVGAQTEGILTHGQAVAEEVHEKVDRTAASVQKTINAPIIGVNSLAAGVLQGLQTFRILQRKRTHKITEISEQPPRSTNISAPSAVKLTANINGAPVALCDGKGN